MRRKYVAHIYASDKKCPLRPMKYKQKADWLDTYYEHKPKHYLPATLLVFKSFPHTQNRAGFINQRNISFGLFRRSSSCCLILAASMAPRFGRPWGRSRSHFSSSMIRSASATTQVFNLLFYDCCLAPQLL